MFNANPLLRYDGYYILSDVLEIPNLRQKASTILNRKLGKWCLGLEEPDDPFLPKRHQSLFALYTVASAIYRWVVTLSILYFLNKVFEPYGLKVLGQIDRAGRDLRPGGAAVGESLQVFQGSREAWQSETLADVHDAGGARRGRSRACCFIPLPSHIYCPLEVQARDAASVYVDQPGILGRSVREAGRRRGAGAAAGAVERLCAWM